MQVIVANKRRLQTFSARQLDVHEGDAFVQYESHVIYFIHYPPRLAFLHLAFPFA